ncbi:MAG: DDE-type integrase/transposase/recombinase [Peptococcales bacterium]|jgi:transposase InsO family protein
MAYTINPKLPGLRMEAVKKIRNEGWSVRQTARYYGYNPSTVSRWLNRAPDDMRKTIPTRSSRPHHHPAALSEEKVRAIVKVRLEHNKCAEVVQKQLKNDGMNVSLSSVKRTLVRTNLIRYRSPWKKWHYSLPRPQAEKPGDLLQLDTVHFVTSSGKRFYVYTIIDLYSRWAYAEVVKKISAGESVRFLRNARKRANFDFVMVQSDNGPEFTQWFTRGVARMKIAHRHSRIRKCNDNAHIERFNRTIQEECFGVEKPVNYDRYLSLINDYLKYYNTSRLHLSLGLKTPAEMLA